MFSSSIGVKLYYRKQKTILDKTDLSLFLFLATSTSGMLSHYYYFPLLYKYIHVNFNRNTCKPAFM